MSCACRCGRRERSFATGDVMAKRDRLMSTIEAIHAAGLDEARWPDALAAVVSVVGGCAASIELCDQRDLRHLEMHAYGMPGAEEVAFREDFAEINIRLPFVARQKLGELSWDYMILDEAAMRRAPFYTEIMPRFDMRYFVGNIIRKTTQDFATVGVHFPSRMGHVQRDGIATMRLLSRHISQSYDVARRLRAFEEERRPLERLIDCLADGMALLRRDGAVAFANASFQAIVRRSDGIRLRGRMIEFTDTEARAKYDSALAAVLRLRGGAPETALSVDFTVARVAAGRAYLLSVRPLAKNAATLELPEAVAIIFVRDPLARASAPLDSLRRLFALTEAEAVLALALQSGTAPVDYARHNALSLNTVYTHLRRLREKTGCSGLTELIQKLDELRLPLRRG